MACLCDQAEPWEWMQRDETEGMQELPSGSMVPGVKERSIGYRVSESHTLGKEASLIALPPNSPSLVWKVPSFHCEMCWSLWASAFC